MILTYATAARLIILGAPLIMTNPGALVVLASQQSTTTFFLAALTYYITHTNVYSKFKWVSRGLSYLW